MGIGVLLLIFPKICSKVLFRIPAETELFLYI